LPFQGALNDLPAKSATAIGCPARGSQAAGGEKYGDFGPTLVREKLAELHSSVVSVETLCQWMLRDGVWLPRDRRLPRPHQPRARRPCLGELVQIDGCDNEWFEGRAPRCVLLVYVDDATSHFGPRLPESRLWTLCEQPQDSGGLLMRDGR
jgi:hypothetical protein